MATTPNFGWQTPNDTDYVKDGASAIRTLGNAIDASMADLEGGTTGQVLAKNSNTDMDFVWTTVTADITEVNAGVGISGGGTSGAVTITNSMATAIDAKGDLVAGTGADTFARLAVGANNTVLTADSTTATGLKWASVSAGGMTLLSTTTISGTSTSVTGISQDYKDLLIIVDNTTSSTGGTRNCNLKTSGGTSLNVQASYFIDTSGYTGSPDTSFGPDGQQANWSTTGGDVWAFTIYDYASTTRRKAIAWTGRYITSASSNRSVTGYGAVTDTSAIAQFFYNSSQSLTGGTIRIWGIS